MKYELTREQLEEMVQCIVINHLDVDEAMEYALSVCSAFTCDDAEVIWPEKSGDNMEFTHLTGEAVKAGVVKSKLKCVSCMRKSGFVCPPYSTATMQFCFKCNWNTPHIQEFKFNNP